MARTANPRTHHWIALLTAIVYIITGLLITFNPLWNMAVMGVFFSAMLLVGGVFDVWRYFLIPKRLRHTLNLVGAIITIVVALILLGSSFASQATLLSTLLGFWLMFSGVSRISAATMLKKLNVPAARTVLFTGIALTVASLLILFTPVASSLVMGVFIGLSFLIAGVSKLFDFFFGRDSVDEFAHL